jgi:hypothetical protein
MMPMQPGPTGPPDIAGPPGPGGAPGGGPPGPGGGMAPQQAQMILQKLGIGPQQLPMVMQACMTMMEASQGAQQAPPQGGGLMQELSSRYQEPAA